MEKVLSTIVAYLGQDSTWRGIISLATAGGVVVSPELSASIIATGMALIGLINVFRDQDKSE